MADEVEGKKHHGMSRLLSKAGFRSKSSGKDDLVPNVAVQPVPPMPPLSNDVADFLRPSTNAAAARAKANPPRAPKIDIAAAQRYSDTVATQNVPADVSTPPADRERRRRKPKRPGLLLRFDESPPEIIGCGGEEEDTPPAEIGLRKRHAGTTRIATRSGQPTLPQVSLRARPGPEGVPGYQSSQDPFTDPQMRLPANTQPYSAHPDGRLDQRFSNGSNNLAAYSQGNAGEGRFGPPQRAQTHGFEGDFDARRPSVQQAQMARGIASQGRTSEQQTEDDFVPRPIKRTQTGRTNSMPGPESDEDNPVPRRLGRTATGFTSQDSDRSTLSSQDNTPSSSRGNDVASHRLSYHLPELQSIRDGSPIDGSNRDGFLPASPRDARSFSAQLLHRMKTDEGRALYQAARSPQNLELDSDDSPPRPMPATARASKAVPPPLPLQSSQTKSSQQYLDVKDNVPGAPPLTPQMSHPSPTYDMPQPTPMPVPQRAQTLRKALPSPHSGADRPLSPPSPPSSSQPPAPPPHGRAPRDYFETAAERRDSAGLSPLVIPEAKPAAQRPSPSNSLRTPQSSSTVATATSAKTSLTLRSAPPTSSSYDANQAALDDFAERCSHMNGIFRLQAEFDRPIPAHSPNEWLRAAAWWFIRSRAGLESMIRGRPRNPDGTPTVQQAEGLLHQPHVDLAKCHWIMTEVLGTHSGLPPSVDSNFAVRAAAARDAGIGQLEQLFASADIVMAHLRALCGSVARNQVMPPHNALIQGQDQSIWLAEPPLSPTLSKILSSTFDSNSPRPMAPFNPLSVMALAETPEDFVYNRTFAKTVLGSKSSRDITELSCLVSLMRGRNDWQPKLCICTQKETLTLCVTKSRELGPSWNDVQWSEPDRLLRVNLPGGYWLDLRLEQQDFRQLYTMYNHSYEVQSTLLPAKEEQLVFDEQLREFQFIDTRRVLIFPPDRIKRCRVKVFARYESRMHGGQQQNMSHVGFRVVVVTSPKNKMLGVVSHIVGADYPIFVAMLGENGPGGEVIPILNVQIIEEDRKCQFYMVFQSEQSRIALYNVLNSVECVQGERTQGKLRLKGLTIDDCDGTPIGPISTCQWQSVTVIEEASQTPANPQAPAFSSSKRRITASAIDAAITDRVDLGFDPIQIRLPVNGQESLQILRDPQEDLTFIVQTNQSRLSPDLATEALQHLRKLHSIHTYTFYSAVNLHAFQEAATGHAVLYDAIISAFSISRKKAGGGFSLHRKTLEAGISRIQIVTRRPNTGTCTLLAFFEDFSAADSLSITLSSTDIIEPVDLKGDRTTGRGRFGVRLVDKRFTLPVASSATKDLKAMIRRVKDSTTIDVADESVERDEAAAIEAMQRKFVCLDDRTAAAAHGTEECEDVVLAFDAETERSSFLSNLPAVASPTATRSSTSVRRRKEES